ncbi:MAG TPA: MBL fold metallo-hydrolase [Pyrinomonadaceae bacterium]|jgi:glyoxylase-like metal-dependent hydrolase (beta-lactamase superfamily II)/ferredoxin|nr:MBL fold metallo-hydrolase [Pyrinomonadaceae bacterium]
MANVLQRLPENVPGDFFVDASCIDCDTCSQLAPEMFRDHGDQCSVYHQPEAAADTRLALMALVACPTGSIGTTQKHDAHIGIDAFPSLIAENVYFCGFTSESSFGAWSYLIVRPESEGGNVLIDSPRFATQLVKRIEKLGGVRQMLLTHKDDVADHELFRKKFGCERIMHVDEGAARLGVEQIISGEAEIQLDKELLVIPTPGHTRGHVVFLYQGKFLFTGDHLAWSPKRQTLTAFPSVAWYSWPRQIESMAKLAQHDFEWVLPGHGSIHHDSKANMRYHLQSCINWMKTRG